MTPSQFRREDSLNENKLPTRIISLAKNLLQTLDLSEVLHEVVDSGAEILSADRVSVLLLDSENGELYSRASSAREEIRFNAAEGIAGETLEASNIIRIDDCYADGRFNQEVDRETGYRTESMVSIPLLGVDREPVGVMQALNASRGHFNEQDEQIAEIVASLAALAIQRGLYFEERLTTAKLRRDLDVAREIQENLLPKQIPTHDGLEIGVFSRPAEETGGDTFDLFDTYGDDNSAPLMIVLGDATGHGIGAALSVTQMRSMLRTAAALGADLDTMCSCVNDQLAADLPSNRFITAFVGMLDTRSWTLSYRAWGQGPLLHFHAAKQECDWLPASTTALGFFGNQAARPVPPLRLEPGDIFALLTDGFYEYEDPEGTEMEKEGIGALVAEHAGASASELITILTEALAEHARGAPQEDDLTAVILKRA